MTLVLGALLLAYAARPVLIPGGSLAAGAAARPVAPAIRMADGPAPLDVEVRKLPKSSIALDIKVSKEVTNEIHLKTLAKLAKGAKVPGFRDGKVPPQAVIAKLGMQKVKEATVEQIVDAGMQHSGVGQRIHTVGEARLPEELEGLAARYTVGEALDFTVEVDVYPEAPVEEAKYKALSVEVEREEFNQEAYDAALVKLRKQHAASVDMGASTGAAPGNALKVNMNGYLATPDGAKGEALPAVAGGDGIEIPMEEGKFMPGLVEGLVGATQGETRDITVTFPARSSAAMLSGKTAIFEVEVLNVFRKELPEPGDDFADQVKARAAAAAHSGPDAAAATARDGHQGGAGRQGGGGGGRGGGGGGGWWPRSLPPHRQQWPPPPAPPARPASHCWLLAPPPLPYRQRIDCCCRR